MAKEPKEPKEKKSGSLPAIGNVGKVLKKAPVLPQFNHPSNMKTVNSFFFFDEDGNRISDSDDLHPDGFVNLEAAREWLFENEEIPEGTVLELRLVTRYVK